MALQRSQWGFQIHFAEIISLWGLRALGMFALFLLLTIMLSKAWCGWICPFGTLQDWIASLRKRTGIRESQFNWGLRDGLKPVKYILLILLILIPLMIANAGLHSDFMLPFCQICPAKTLMPVFEGNFRYFAIDVTNSITTVMTILSVVLAAGFLAGMFFKDRFFCIFCPLLALIALFDRFGLLRLKKRVAACIGCGTCQRVCPMDIRGVHIEKKKENLFFDDCMLCLKCAESCPGDGVLSLNFLKRKVFSSSKNYISRAFIGFKN